MKTRETRFLKKFQSARKLIFTEIYSWLPTETVLRQITVFPSHPKGLDAITDGQIILIDEFMSLVRTKVMACGVARCNAISENYPLLRLLEHTHSGYNCSRLFTITVCQ